MKREEAITYENISRKDGDYVFTARLYHRRASTSFSKGGDGCKTASSSLSSNIRQVGRFNKNRERSTTPQQKQNRRRENQPELDRESSSSLLFICLHGFPDSQETFHQIAQDLIFNPQQQQGNKNIEVLVPVMRGYELSSVQHSYCYNALERLQAAGPKEKEEDEDDESKHHHDFQSSTHSSPFHVPKIFISRTQYTIKAIAQDVLNWADFLHVEEFVIIGHDWGSVVGHAVNVMAPHRVSAFIGLAIPPLRYFFYYALLIYPVQILYSFYMLLFQFPIFPEWLITSTRFIAWLWKRWSPEDGTQAVRSTTSDGERKGGKKEDNNSLLITTAANQVVSHFSKPENFAIAWSALGYYRCLLNPLSKGMWESWKILFQPISKSTKTLLLFGEQDHCMYWRLCLACCQVNDEMRVEEKGATALYISTSKLYPGGCDIYVLKNAGHFLHLDEPQQVQGVISNWLIGNHIV